MKEQTKSLALGERLLAAAQEEESWVVRMGGTEQKLTIVEIVDAYNERLIDPETYVWTNGMHAWQKLEAVDAIVDALHAEAARHEVTRDDSAMFSLATLMNGSQPRESDDGTDDSGLIDLAALTAAAQPAEPAMFASDLFAAPASAPAAPAVAPRDNRGVVGTLIAAVVVLSVVLGFKVLVRPEPPAPAPVIPTVATSAEVALPVAPPPLPEETAAPEVASPPSSAPKTAATPPALPTRKVPPPVTSAKPPVTPAPKTSSCPCKPDDLVCNMRCATAR